MKSIFKHSANIIFIMTCILATIDTHLFGYQSLSKYLLLESGIVIMAAICLCPYILDKQTVIIGKFELLISVWIAYVILHGTFMAETFESYRTYYLCVTLAMAVVLVKMQRKAMLIRENIEMGLLVICFIHIIYIIGQWTGVTDSGNAFFEITGSNENPTVTALYLVGCLPMLISRMRLSKSGMLYVLLSCMSIISIWGLRCRTAYIGLAMEIAIMMIMALRRKSSSIKWNVYNISLTVFVLLLFVSVAGTKMYGMKKDSADGRLLIWKLSAEMIAANPAGYGYGLFEKNYNLYQADHFSGHEHSGTERRNADFVYVPYNDYLEHGVEGGIVGMGFLAVFYVVMIRKAVLADDRKSAAVFGAFAVMSLFNFVYTSIQPWFLIICHSSFVAKQEAYEEIPKRNPVYTNVLWLMPVVFVAYKIYGFTDAQISLCRIRTQACSNYSAVEHKYKELETNIGTSEIYWSSRANNAFKAELYEDALVNIHKARLYSSQPALFAMEYSCLRCLGNESDAVSILDTMSYMLPQKLSVKYMLMKHYIHIGNLKKARHYADDILSTGTKVESDEANMIINKAKQFKESYE